MGHMCVVWSRVLQREQGNMCRHVPSQSSQPLDLDVVDTAATETVALAPARLLPILLSVLSQQPRSRWPGFLHLLQNAHLVVSARSVEVESGSLGSLLSASSADFLASTSVDLGSPTVATCRYFDKPARKLLSRKLTVGRTSNWLASFIIRL
jgi:hypothetical protein